MSHTEAFRSIASPRRLRCVGRGRVSIFLRSLLFRLLAYGYALLGMGVMLPLMPFLPGETLLRMAQRWAAFSVWLLEHFCGVRIEVTGLEQVPGTGCLIACQHQSMIETLVLSARLRLPATIIKQQLLWIPFLRFYAGKVGLIPIERSNGPLALHGMLRRAHALACAGRPILIFPEGGRQPAGVPFRPRPGVIALYDHLALACVPVRVETGHLCPSGGFNIRPGIARIAVQPVIAPGLSRSSFSKRLIAAVS